MRVLVSAVLAFLLLFVPEAQAHLAGQAPFVKINGKYTDFYPVPSTSLDNLSLPQDKTVENFLLQQKVEFQIDISAVQVPPEIVQKTKFEWNFGDGNKDFGVTVSHSYTRIGSFITELYAHSPDTPEPVLLQATMVNILPDKNYQLPKARIQINGWESKDPLTDILKAPPSQTLNLDGSKSESFNSEVMEYTWDFGDRQSATGAKTNHLYQNQTMLFPMLRIKTKDGFISDTFAEINLDPLNPSVSNNPSQNTPPKPGSDLFKIGSALAIFLAVMVLVWLGWRRSRRR